MRALLGALFILGTLAAAGLAYVAYGINWDEKITQHLTTLKSQTGFDIRATPGSALTFKGLRVQGLLVTGPRGIQGLMRDVTFSLDWHGWLTGQPLFDQIHLSSLDILKQGTPLYTEKDLTFFLKKTADDRLVLSGHGMALRLWMRPEQTDFDTVFGGNWLISGSWMPGGRLVFRAPAKGLQGLEGTLTLKPGTVSGDLRVIKENAGNTLARIGGLSLETMIPESVDLTLRSDQAYGLKKAVVRLHRQRASDPVALDVTGEHALGAFAAKITAEHLDSWKLTLKSMKLGTIEGSGSWSIEPPKEGRAHHEVHLRLRYLSLSQSSSMDLFSSLRQLQDHYHLTLAAEDIQMGALRLPALEMEATVDKQSITASFLRAKTSLEGRFSLSGTLSYATNTPYFNMDLETAGPFFTDLIASFPNFPKTFSHLNGDMQTKIQGYAHYPEITLQHRDGSGAVASFKGHLEPLTAPPRFNGLVSYRFSPETKVSMTVVRGEKDLKVSSLQGTLGGFPFSGQATADLETNPPIIQASLYAPNLSTEALVGLGAMNPFHSQDSSACREAGGALALPMANTKDINTQIRLRIDRLIIPEYGDLTQVDQKLSLSPAGAQLSLVGRHGRGNLAGKIQMMPGQSLPILEMAFQSQDVVLPDWGGSNTLFLKTTSFGACLQDHLQTVTGQGTFKANNLRPTPAFLKKIQALAGPALGRTLTPQDVDLRSVWLQGSFREGTLVLQEGEINLPSANVSLRGGLQLAAQKVALKASVTSPQSGKPMIITVGGRLSSPDIQINNQSLWEYLLLGRGR